MIFENDFDLIENSAYVGICLAYVHNKKYKYTMYRCYLL